MAEDIVVKIKEMRDRLHEKDQKGEMITEEEARQMHELVFGSKNAAHWADFLIVGDEGPTEFVRLWIAKSIPCVSCNVAGDSKPEGAGKFAIAFLNIKHDIAIRFLCDECAQKLQNELNLRGIEITTKEQLAELKSKLNIELVEPEDDSELA